VLVEAPMAMALGDAETLVEEAARRRLTLAVSHPMRLRAELAALRHRIAAGRESVRAKNGIFYVTSPRAPIGGKSPTRIDNLLLHHLSHKADLSHWITGSGGGAATGWMAPADAAPGIPMEAWVAIGLASGFALLSASYHGRDTYEIVIVTDRDTYRFDQRHATFADSAGTRRLIDAKTQCLEVARDFVGAIESAVPPVAPGATVLPAMRSLQAVQDFWDRSHGTMSIPGRRVGTER
jgi:predicted dehydrogenase